MITLNDQTVRLIAEVAPWFPEFVQLGFEQLDHGTVRLTASLPGTATRATYDLRLHLSESRPADAADLRRWLPSSIRHDLEKQLDKIAATVEPALAWRHHRRAQEDR